MKSNESFFVTERKNPTSFDVAKEAGVSQTTVSRVYNGKWQGRIKESTLAKVLDAAERIGYAPNALARGLISKKTGIIGIVMSDTFNVFYSEVLNRLTNEFQRRNFKIMVFNTTPDHDMNQILNRMLEYQIDGIIVTSSALTNQISGLWVDRGVPLVLLNTHSNNVKCNTVYCDNLGACRDVARYLCELGHRRIAYVSASNSLHKNHMMRQNGFLLGLQEQGIMDCQIVPGDYSYQSGKDAADLLFGDAGTHPDAVFCANDRMAMGVMDAVRYQYGLSIPHDVSVIGFDDTEVASNDAYQLTTVRQQIDTVVQETVQLLLRNLENPEMKPQTICLPMELVVRASSGPC